MKFKTAIQNIDFELNQLVFSRVFRTHTKEEHRCKPDNDENSFSYYYGFSTEINLFGKSQSHRIWFKKNTKTRQPVYFGPVALYATTKIPLSKTILVGVVDVSPKGRSYRWWIDDAFAILQFCRFVRYQNGLKHHSALFYRQLKLQGEYHDELWALAKLLLFGDIMSFLEPKKHPVEKNQYAFKEGYAIRLDPAKFVLATTLFARDITIYDRYMTLLERRKQYDNTLPSIQWVYDYLNKKT